MAGDNAAFIYANIYAVWGRLDGSLRWLALAYRMRDPGLVDMKVAPMMASVRQAALSSDRKSPGLTAIISRADIEIRRDPALQLSTPRSPTKYLFCCLAQQIAGFERYGPAREIPIPSVKACTEQGDLTQSKV